MANKVSATLLIQFARAPLAGLVKTRMLPYLTAQQACDLHCELVLWSSAQLVDSVLGDIELAVAGDPAHPLFTQCLELGVNRISRQRGVGLGKRMYSAIRDGLQCHTNVILVGSDCPGIDREYLDQALCALDTAPLVLGPAEDGGYVLIGAREIHRELFEEIPWGTEQVYAKTIESIRKLDLNWAELPTLADVDRPGDLAAWNTLRDGA
ncbi:MAG: glycosyltransferase [Gammaproteobacteria bacterium]|nr:MAG: glycosyltransferase [Gammaproteobacteria bacterium]